MWLSLLNVFGGTDHIAIATPHPELVKISSTYGHSYKYVMVVRFNIEFL